MLLLAILGLFLASVWSLIILKFWRHIPVVSTERTNPFSLGDLGKPFLFFTKHSTFTAPAMVKPDFHLDRWW